MRDQRMLAVSALLTMGVITFAEVSEHDALPQPNQWVGFAFAFVVMAAISDLGEPAIGNGLALVLFVTVLVTRGQSVLDYIVKFTNRRNSNARGTRPGRNVRPGSVPAVPRSGGSGRTSRA